MSGITPLPTPPSTSDPSNFSTRADDFLSALPTFVTEANDLAAALNNISTTSTSVTSNTIGTGSKAFVVDLGKSYFPGQSVTIARTGAPTNRMFAVVDSYDSGTGALVVTSQAFEGSGTFTDWTITLGFNGYPIKIVGTVSESGGVPTGAIIEQGSNANGEYVKYADGTMICTKALSFSSSGSALGALYGSAEASNTFAATFNAAPKISTGGDTGQGSGAALFFATRSAATTSVFVRAVSTTSIATTVTGHLIAIGRWFA